MILHIDMDAFYASVEALDNPALKDRCVIVGQKHPRSVVSAANYHARKFGVHSAMPMFQALEKCPHAVVLPVRMKRYKEVSRQIMAVFSTFSPLVEPVSIDEAFMDISGCARLFGEPEPMAYAIKQAVAGRFGLTCSVGGAPLRFLAKIASDMDKPDGLTIIHEDEVDDFIAALPVAKVPGVGRRTLDVLASMGIQKLGDVAGCPKDLLVRRLGKFGHRLRDLASGKDPTGVAGRSAAKSISSEETFSKDLKDKSAMKPVLLRHAQDVGRQLRGKNLKAACVVLKLKHDDFKLVTRSHTLDRPTESTEVIYRTAADLLDKYRLVRPVRLMGVGVSGLSGASKPIQSCLFEKDARKNESWEKVDRTVDRILDRFGDRAVRRAVLKDDP